ncbi:MAG: hypothetical protein FGM54_01875 [Chitinophagaceae bacterium]|nr:hypothetical protein [Chitinophagaceae bacterium]
MQPANSWCKGTGDRGYTEIKKQCQWGQDFIEYQSQRNPTKKNINQKENVFHFFLDKKVEQKIKASEK